MQLNIGEWVVRSWRQGDRPALVKYGNNHNIWINLRDSFPHPYTEKDAVAWIRHATSQSPETEFAIATSQEAIGGIGLRLQSDVFRHSAEIGYWLAEPFWCRGIATRAVQAVTEHGFSHFDLVRVYAHVMEWNPASARVLEKAGYTYEGRLRHSVTKDSKLVDELVYALVR